MSTDPVSGDAVTPQVVTVVLVRDPSALGEGLDALAAQVYGSVETIIVGGAAEGRAEAERRGFTWLQTMRELRDAIDAGVTYVWFTNEQVRPRPDALGALVREADRIDASVAGSKALRRDDPSILVSVGIATDVFAVPYLGLEHDERDQSQFDVIRDVGAASADSLLVRRDLLAGLRGPDEALAPEAAGIDFCFRARLRGARIVVVPSSEVLVPVASRRAPTPWIEEAGRIRAMIKSYSVVTLLWALPLAFLLGLVEAVVSPLLGRWTLFRLAAAWVWNIVRLPGTIAARFAARSGRVAGDEELFRYQVRGSARLRALWTEAGEQIQERLARGRVGGLSSWLAAGQAAVRSAGFLWGAGTVVVVMAATRSIWSGRLPAVGFSLPPADDAIAVMEAYAGGWNPAGLGTLWPLRPAVGVVAVVQRLLLDRPELTASVLTVAALLAGAFGTARLLRGFGLSAAASYWGGFIYILGPAAAAVADTTHWTAIVALGPLPWALRLALAPWPRRATLMAGRIGTLVLVAGLGAAFLPAVIAVAPAALALWALVGTGDRWWPPVRALAAAAAALPLLFPWLGIVDAVDYLQHGEATFWSPSLIVAALFGVAVAAPVLAGDRLLSTLAAWGGLVAVGGGAVARLGDSGAGTDAGLAGLIAAAIGSGIVTAAAIETLRQLELPGWRRTLGAAGAAAAVALGITAVTLILPGRAGLPEDRLRGLLEFTAESSTSRALLLGDPESLPGDSRSLDGTAYRVTSVPTPRLWESRLGIERQADRALEAALRSIIEGGTARAGEVLAPFGIKWVIFVDEGVLDPFFAGQLDLLPLPGLDETAFVGEGSAVRAVDSEGVVWDWDPPGYRGSPAATVQLAEAADRRWGPGEWSQRGWANQVAAGGGVAAFEARSELRREALAAAGYALVLLVMSLLGLAGRRR